ncbi:MAG: hypothetical protein H7Y38_05085 [Armatimonadetes bacterium]|nr:hypothetical protein [Armatimonadota bacterium]
MKKSAKFLQLGRGGSSPVATVFIEYPNRADFRLDGATRAWYATCV